MLGFSNKNIKLALIVIHRRQKYSETVHKQGVNNVI